MASSMGIPTVIQEQNSYAGLTNKLLARKVDRICVAFPGMERFFPKNKIVMTGNPVRADLQKLESKQETARRFFEWGQNKKTLLIFGGSLGAGSLNRAVSKNIGLVREHADCLVILQTGSTHFEGLKDKFQGLENVRLLPFIERMDLAYSIADLVICRAGAITLSELGVAGKPAILVPSPNVAEDHQTKNAKAVVASGAAKMVVDENVEVDLMEMAYKLLESEQEIEQMQKCMKEWGRPDATSLIVNEIINIASESF
jgi:UDP-N-acetylglucosamine--N-acetylmuramyl-(pentapeptide) pyrophosphoryl-undecaprenol N-acetylglucosamine transferase